MSQEQKSKSSAIATDKVAIKPIIKPKTINPKAPKPKVTKRLRQNQGICRRLPKS